MATVRQLMAAGVLREVDPVALAALLGIGLSAMSSATPALRQLFDVDLADPTVRAALGDAVADIIVHGVLPRPPP